MGVAFMGDVIIHGNFEEVLPEMPKDFHYDRDAKWLQPFDLEWRETLGGVICSCKTVEVHFAPYYGFDYYHMPTCNLMRKLDAEPQINNLIETYLPAMNQYSDSVPADSHIKLYIKGAKRSRSSKVPVRVLSNNNLSLFGGK